MKALSFLIRRAASRPATRLTQSLQTRRFQTIRRQQDGQSKIPAHYLPDGASPPSPETSLGHLEEVKRLRRDLRDGLNDEPTSSEPAPGSQAWGGVSSNSNSDNGNGNGNGNSNSGSLGGVGGENHVDWSRSFRGLSDAAFPPEAAAILLAPIVPQDVEIKPDGIIYLPEIKYRRILNRAFGPGGWGMAPRGETIITEKTVTREYGMVVNGRLVSISRGEQVYFDPEGIPTATEGCKSNAMMRCCKDLGIASELWDPRFVREFMAKHAKDHIVEHCVTRKRRRIWLRKEDSIAYPYKAVEASAPAPPRTYVARTLKPTPAAAPVKPKVAPSTG